LSQQVLQRNGEKVTFDEPNPFVTEGEEAAYAAYCWKLRYETSLVARC
jgi:translation initiation factor 3 subunit D